MLDIHISGGNVLGAGYSPTCYYMCSCPETLVLLLINEAMSGDVDTDDSSVLVFGAQLFSKINTSHNGAVALFQETISDDTRIHTIDIGVNDGRTYTRLNSCIGFVPFIPIHEISQYSTSVILHDLRVCTSMMSIERNHLNGLLPIFASKIIDDHLMSGDCQYKIIIEWISASLVARTLVLHEIEKDTRLTGLRELIEIIISSEKSSISELFKSLFAFSKMRIKEEQQDKINKKQLDNNQTVNVDANGVVDVNMVVSSR